MLAVLKIARFEVKKSGKRYGRGSATLILIAIILSASMSYLSVLTGVDSDRGIYTVNVAVEKGSFSYSAKPDVLLKGNAVFVTSSDRSLAAADELIGYLKDKYRKEIEERYGELAHPVRVNVIYLHPAKVSGKIEETSQTASKPANTPPPTTTAAAPTTVTETTLTVPTLPTPTTGKNLRNYVPPQDIRTPSLVDRMVMAFLFVIPSYFAVQVFSSSLLEDKMLRRLEVLLSVTSRVDLLAGKILPYLLISIISAIAVSVYFKSYAAFIFALPVVFLLFSAQAFAVMISRTYREATFLLLVVSLLITIYAFIPAVFSSAIPLSKISPITLLIAYIHNGSVNLIDAAISFAHFGVMAVMLLYFTMKAFSPDIAQGKQIFQKLVEISKLSVTSDARAFTFAFLSISFAFMAELFAILTVFILPRQLMVPALLLCVAFVEEFIKGLIVFSSLHYRRAIATALGFFAGEKILVVLNVLRDYSIAFLGQYLVLPLILHVITVLVIVLTARRGYFRALGLAAAIHFVYDYAVVVLLA
ncbi:ABC transporter permease [Archaeoglobus neptunius]|uniref:ABC transporter permease n=1 Tax=Archaeoglobus neptunius TaxID=2798580 RepID=UPI0019263457|nr:ABC transporter permease [Archaeoglobus neptunius]